MRGKKDEEDGCDKTGETERNHHPPFGIRFAAAIRTCWRAAKSVSVRHGAILCAGTACISACIRIARNSPLRCDAQHSRAVLSRRCGDSNGTLANDRAERAGMLKSFHHRDV